MVEAVRLVNPAPLPLMTPVVTVSGTLTNIAVPLALNEFDTAIEFSVVSATMSELVPLAALPKAARAAAGVDAPVPPFATGSVPATSDPRATAPAAQLLPL